MRLSMLRLFQILIALMLVAAVAFTLTNPLGEDGPAIYGSNGKRYAAKQQIGFPIIMETSSLAYDDSSGTFYTTGDKSRPHIVQFRLKGRKVEVIRADTISGIRRNFDFEGIEIVARRGQPRYLQISTERLRRKDSVLNPAVTLDSFKYLPDISIALRPEGMGQNNNLEAVTYIPKFDLLLFGKERVPFGLYGRENGGEQFRIFGQSDFLKVYERWVDSVMSPIVPVDRLALLKGVAISGLAYDSVTNTVLVLNRFGRSIIQLRLTKDSKYHWELVDVWPYAGIDDATAESVSPIALVYGLAEGLAIFGQGDDRALTVITDPGQDGRPTLYVFPIPRRLPVTP